MSTHGREADLELLDRGLDDLLQMSEITWVVKSALGLTDDELRAAVLEVLRRLDSEGLAELGDAVLRQGQVVFKPWGGSVESRLERISQLWPSDLVMPGLGDIGWMRVTPAGAMHVAQTHS